MRELTRLMIRIGDLGKVLLVTAVAIRRKTCIAAVGMTRYALHGHVSAGQWKHGFRMVECRWLPRNIRMTCRAIVGELIRLVIRINNLHKVLLVTAETISRKTGISSAGMTGRALHGHVSAGQWKRGFRMVECRWLPHNIRMACRAIVRELIRLMIRIDNLGKVLQVTAVAIRRKTGISSVCMTRSALHGHMRTCKRKIGFGVIERRRPPSDRIVALQAVS
jgi:hypothetical protein